MNQNEKQTYSSYLYLSLYISSLVLITVSYIIGYIVSKESASFSVEVSVTSSFLFNVGSITLKAALALVSVSTALRYASTEVVAPAFIGGVIIAKGSTISALSGNILGISGIFGCVLTGYISALAVNFCEKHLIKYNSNAEIIRLIFCIFSIFITLSAALIINSTANAVNTFATDFITNLADRGSFLLPVIIGIFMVADGGGPFYLSGYFFGVTSIVANEPQIMAMVTAAGMTASLSLALFTFLYRDRLKKAERFTAYTGIIPAFVGLPQLSYPFYIIYKLKVIFPIIAGSVCTSLLTLLLKCKSESAIGGFLAQKSSDKPLYMLLSVIFGVLISTFLLTLTIKAKDTNSNAQEESQKK